MAEINAYAGNAGIGYGQTTGGGTVGYHDSKVVIDALDRFAMYNFYAKRDLWNRANKEKDELAEKAAANLSFTYGDMLAPDRERVNNSVAELYKLYEKNPNAVSLKMGPGGESNQKDHAEFLERRNNILADIVRANKRKAQATVLDTQIAGITDKNKAAKAAEFRDQQLNTTLEDDIQLWQDFKLFDTNGYVKKIMPTTKFDQLKTGPNQNEITTYELGDIGAAMGAFDNDYANNFDGVRDEVDAMTAQYNEILERNKVDGKVDQEKLKKDPSKMGGVILDMLQKSNAYLDYYNSDDVQKNVGTGVQQKVNIDDNIDSSEMMRLMLTSKSVRENKLQVQQTDNEIQKGQLSLGWARIKQDQAELGERIRQYNNSDKSEFLGGDLGNLAWYNMAKAADDAYQSKQANGTPAYVDISGQGLENAFARDTGVMVEEKEYNEDGDVIGVKKRAVRQAPREIAVIPDPGGDPNKFSVHVMYATDPSKPGSSTFTKKFSAQEAYDAMGFMSGRPNDVKALSEMNTKFRLKAIGSTKPDFNAYKRYYEKGEAGAAAATPVKEKTSSSETITIKVGGKPQQVPVSTMREWFEQNKNNPAKVPPGTTFEQYLEILRSR